MDWSRQVLIQNAAEEARLSEQAALDLEALVRATSYGAPLTPAQAHVVLTGLQVHYRRNSARWTMFEHFLEELKRQEAKRTTAPESPRTPWWARAWAWITRRGGSPPSG